MLNRAEIIGFVGRDPEVRHTQSGTAVATFSIATSEKWKDKDGKQQESTEWHRIVAWDKKAELVQKHVTTGKPLRIEGKLQTRKWDDKDGVTHYTTEIILKELTFLPDGKGGKGPPAHDDADQPQGYVPQDPGTDDIPF